jgi:DNA-binding transcriptional LysR family regulator
MSVETWDEIRTAYHVARLGTVSGAAEALGVHHATVIRHIDALEHRLGTKLFQRHARGYTATEAGQDLLRVAQATDDQFTQLSGRIKGQGQEVSGELVVTSVPGFSDRLAPVLVQFQQAHPGLVVRYLSDERVFRLEYGEAHVAIRAGSVPDQPDNVVQPLMHQEWALYAAPSYVARMGLPADESDLHRHQFVGHDLENARAPFLRWLRANVPAGQIVFRSTDFAAMRQAIVGGAGIGFLSKTEARLYPDLVQVLPPRDEWSGTLWIVTHVDLHRTTKVQAFLTALKQAAKGWDMG